MGSTDDDADYGRIAGNLADALIEAIPPRLVRAALSRVAESGMRATADGRERIRRVAAATATALDSGRCLSPTSTPAGALRWRWCETVWVP